MPETIDTVEFGVLRNLKDARVWASLFRSSWKDAILGGLNPNPPPPFARLNIGENEARGVEAGFTIHRGRWRADPKRLNQQTVSVGTSDRYSLCDPKTRRSPMRRR